MKPNQNRKQPEGQGSHTQAQKALHAKVVTAVFPSRSGNSRVKVVLSNRSVFHFYITPEGEEHIPEGHKKDPVTLDDNELNWAFKTWRKKNPAVQRVNLPAGNDMFKKAEALAIKKFRASEKNARPKHSFIPKSGVTIGSAFGDKLAAIRQGCTD